MKEGVTKGGVLRPTFEGVAKGSTDGHGWMVTFSEMGGQNPGYETAMTSYEMMSEISAVLFPGTSSKIPIYFAVGRMS
jgi:hypothetical protein